MPKRKIENIRKLNALYIDIDYYNIESLKTYDHERILAILENDYFDRKFQSQALQYLLDMD